MSILNLRCLGDIANCCQIGTLKDRYCILLLASALTHPQEIPFTADHQKMSSRIVYANAFVPQVCRIFVFLCQPRDPHLSIPYKGNIMMMSLTRYILNQNQ